MAEARRTGKKNRKHNRKKDSPAQKRYNAEERWNKNKLRRAKRTAKKFNKPVKIKINNQWETVTA